MSDDMDHFALADDESMWRSAEDDSYEQLIINMDHRITQLERALRFAGSMLESCAKDMPEGSSRTAVLKSADHAREVSEQHGSKQ